MVTYQAHEVLSYFLTPEGAQIAEQGSHEARVWSVLSEKGGTPVSLKDLKSKVGDSANIGQGKAFKNGWIVKDGENLYKAVSRALTSTLPSLRSLLWFRYRRFMMPPKKT